MSRRTNKKQRGLTLIEVMVAVSILAVIATISYQSIAVVTASREVIDDKLKELARIDRAWLLLEGDLKNALGHAQTQAFGPGSGELIPPMLIERGGDYELLMLRGGFANPLYFPRTELARVGYRVEDEVLYRDVWYNLSSTDTDEARQQKIVSGVESVEIEVLSDAARSFSAGPWLDRWDLTTQSVSPMPLALRVKIKLENYEEVSRLFPLLKGE